MQKKVSNAVKTWFISIAVLWCIPSHAQEVETPYQQSGSNSPPELDRSGRGAFIPDLPGTPMPTYLLDLKSSGEWSKDEAGIKGYLSSHTFPEAIEFLSIMPPERTVEFRTTRFAAQTLLLPRVDGTLYIKEEAAPELICGKILANVTASTAATHSKNAIEWARRNDGECVANRRFDYLQNLLAEGVDSRSNRLFVVITRDPRWFNHETFTDDGHPVSGPTGKHDWSDMSLIIQAPISDQLSAIRIWEESDDGDLSIIAEIPFDVPEWLD